jgi:sulfhydrogenase subunit beta (sulfur reductase)
MNSNHKLVLEVGALARLLDVLKERGYLVMGPTLRDNAIVYDRLESADQLPIGWRDVQDGGQYRLERRDDAARFGYAVGPHSWKQLLFAPQVVLWRGKKTGDGFQVTQPNPQTPRYAFIWVCS